MKRIERREAHKNANRSQLNKFLFFVRKFFRESPEMHFGMHNHKHRNRIQKSERLLHEALISLIREKKYESITVQQILDRADVGRSTFYLHFRDKDELLLMGFEHLREMLNEVQRKNRTTSARPYENILGFSRPMFEHTSQHRVELKALSGSQAGIFVWQRIQEMISNVIERELKSELKKRRKPESAIPSELFVSYLASTYMSVTSWWLNSKDSIAPESADEVYRSLVTPSLESQQYRLNRQTASRWTMVK